MNQPLAKCPACRRLITPEQVDVVEAVVIRPVPGFGTGPADTAEEPGFVFHEACFPDGDPNWRRL
jgi:hypothetical protein